MRSEQCPGSWLFKFHVLLLGPRQASIPGYMPDFQHGTMICQIDFLPKIAKTRGSDAQIQLSFATASTSTSTSTTTAATTTTPPPTPTPTTTTATTALFPPTSVTALSYQH